jgi:2-oxoglutarate ferredoxin oxidoreductase subunit alpha
MEGVTKISEGRKVLMTGNRAFADAAIEARCRFYAGYPITPQNEIPERMSEAIPRHGGVFVQAESELAAVNMVYGAAATGARAMTSSSSPGISLMQETLSYMAGAEIPAVLVNVQRGGPGLGNISASQGDYFQSTRGGGHGDYRMPVLAPYSVQEAWNLTMHAFDLADRYRTPVMLLSDGVIAQMMEPCLPRPYAPPPGLPGKDWALTGCAGRDPNVIKSLYLGEGELASRNEFLDRKYREWARTEAMAQSLHCDGADLVVVAFGVAARLAHAAIETLRSEGRHGVGLFRPVTLYPFPVDELQGLVRQGRRFVVFELNTGQMVDDVRLALAALGAEVHHVGIPSPSTVTPEDLLARLNAWL